MTSLIFTPRKAQVGLVQLDASVSETHTKTNELTDFPVDEGANITDHIRRVPEEIQITGMVSKTPLLLLAGLRSSSPIDGELDNPDDRVERAYSELQRIMNASELITVVTTLKTYENMAVTSIAATRDAQNGQTLNAVITCREVFVAATETRDRPDPETPSDGAEIDRGRQPTTPASQGVSDSLLRSLF